MTTTQSLGSGRRVRCTLPEADQTYNGFHFARVGDQVLSEPIADEEHYARFCSVPGFQPAGELPPEVVEAVDQAITFTKAAVAEAQRLVRGPESADVHEALADQQRANQAMAADLSAARTRIEELERKLQATEVPRLTAEVDALRRQVQDAGATPAALERENQQLRAANEALGAELRALKEKPARGKAAPAKDEQRGEAS